MRLAFVTTSFPRDEGDPSGHFVHAEVREFERAGHLVSVFSGQGEAFGWPGVATRLKEDPRRALGALRWGITTERALVRGRFDRIVAHWAVPCAWPIAMRAECALDVVSHGGDVRLLLALPAAVRGALVRRIAERASAWRFVSESLLLELVRGLSPEDVRVLQRVAEIGACLLEMPDVTARIAALRTELGALRVAVVVGRLVASKEVERAIEHIARARSHDLLVIVGDGPKREELEALAVARQVAARFVGKVPREEALAWIGASDVLLHASRAEGLSTVIREAEALRVRVERL